MFLALNYCSGIFLKFVSYLYMWWCAQTFLPIFGHFTIFDHNFTEFVDVSDKQEAQVMLITGSTHLAVSRGQQTWCHVT